MTTPNEDSQIDVRKLKLSAINHVNGHETKRLRFEIKADVDKRIIEGYASTFNGWDSYNDTIAPGAYARTIAEKHEGREHSAIKFLWQHAWAEPLGLPIVLREDSKGLEFHAKVVDPTPLGERALVMAAEKVVDGLSIGFDIFPGGAEWLDPSEMSEEELAALLSGGATLDDLWWMPPRRLTEIDLWEVSLVTFPADDGARVELVKSLARTLVPGWRPEKRRAVKAPPTPLPEPAPEPVSPGLKQPCNCRDTKAPDETRGEALGTALDEAISAMVNDDTTREDIIAQLAEAADISEDTVNEIVAGEVDCPPLERLEAFATVLNVSAESPTSAAEDDGCSYDEEEGGEASANLVHVHITLSSPEAARAFAEGLHPGEDNKRFKTLTQRGNMATNDSETATAVVETLASMATELRSL